MSDSAFRANSTIASLKSSVLSSKGSNVEGAKGIQVPSRERTYKEKSISVNLATASFFGDSNLFDFATPKSPSDRGGWFGNSFPLPQREQDLVTTEPDVSDNTSPSRPTLEDFLPPTKKSPIKKKLTPRSPTIRPKSPESEKVPKKLNLLPLRLEKVPSGEISPPDDEEIPTDRELLDEINNDAANSFDFTVGGFENRMEDLEPAEGEEEKKESEEEEEEEEEEELDLGKESSASSTEDGRPVELPQEVPQISEEEEELESVEYPLEEPPIEEEEKIPSSDSIIDWDEEIPISVEELDESSPVISLSSDEKEEGEEFISEIQTQFVDIEDFVSQEEEKKEVEPPQESETIPTTTEIPTLKKRRTKTPPKSTTSPTCITHGQCTTIWTTNVLRAQIKDGVAVPERKKKNDNHPFRAQKLKKDALSGKVEEEDTNLVYPNIKRSEEAKRWHGTHVFFTLEDLIKTIERKKAKACAEQLYQQMLKRGANFEFVEHDDDESSDFERQSDWTRDPTEIFEELVFGFNLSNALESQEAIIHKKLITRKNITIGDISEGIAESKLASAYYIDKVPLFSKSPFTDSEFTKSKLDKLRRYSGNPADPLSKKSKLAVETAIKLMKKEENLKRLLEDHGFEKTYIENACSQLKQKSLVHTSKIRKEEEKEETSSSSNDEEVSKDSSIGSNSSSNSEREGSKIEDRGESIKSPTKRTNKGLKRPIISNTAPTPNKKPKLH